MYVLYLKYIVVIFTALGPVARCCLDMEVYLCLSVCMCVCMSVTHFVTPAELFKTVYKRSSFKDVRTFEYQEICWT